MLLCLLLILTFSPASISGCTAVSAVAAVSDLASLALLSTRVLEHLVPRHCRARSSPVLLPAPGEHPGAVTVPCPTAGGWQGSAPAAP